MCNIHIQRLQFLFVAYIKKQAKAISDSWLIALLSCYINIQRVLWVRKGFFKKAMPSSGARPRDDLRSPFATVIIGCLWTKFRNEAVIKNMEFLSANTSDRAAILKRTTREDRNPKNKKEPLPENIQTSSRKKA